MKALVTVKQIPDEDKLEHPHAKLMVYEDNVIYSDITLTEPMQVRYEEIKEVGAKHNLQETGFIKIITYNKKSFSVPHAKSKLVSRAQKIIDAKIDSLKTAKRISKLPLKYYFHHLSIHSSNLELSEKFYYLLKFEKAYEYEDDLINIFHLKNGYCILELFLYKSSKQKGRKTEIEMNIPLNGVKHFALKVSSIERAKRDIILKGMNLFKDITEGKTGVKHFFLKDPDGILVEIVEDNRHLDPYVVGSNSQIRLP